MAQTAGPGKDRFVRLECYRFGVQVLLGIRALYFEAITYNKQLGSFVPTSENTFPAVASVKTLVSSPFLLGLSPLQSWSTHDSAFLMSFRARRKQARF